MPLSCFLPPSFRAGVGSTRTTEGISPYRGPPLRGAEKFFHLFRTEEFVEECISDIVIFFIVIDNPHMHSILTALAGDSPPGRVPGGVKSPCFGGKSLRPVYSPPLQEMLVGILQDTYQVLSTIQAIPGTGGDGGVVLPGFLKVRRRDSVFSVS